MVRIFIALTPEQDINQKLAYLKIKQKNLTFKDAKVNWAKDNQHHITINFLGSMEPEQREEMFDGFSNNLFYFKDMPIEVSHISYFPNDNGQVLVANITVSQRMQKLYVNVREIVAKIGLGMDLRLFKPHITLARFKEKNRPFSEIIELENPLKFFIPSLDVYESKSISGATKHSLIKSYNFV